MNKVLIHTLWTVGAQTSGRRICEKWCMRACGLGAKIYARPFGFFPFMRAGGLDDARPEIGGPDNTIMQNIKISIRSMEA